MESKVYNELLAHFDNFKDEYAKYKTKGVNVAATRARNSLNEIRKISLDLRREILEETKS
jgi:signal transduction histidine kinase